ncbi:MAG: beta-lactamase family protein, partial [Planctomycetaceae bacterium]|nr:beta-lactamase family protein [Planctomycetaceae bacterium]
IKTHQVPGASLAVTRAGKLVYARGFGYADLAKKQPVQPGSQFRVASLSKPITAVAILQLVDQGKLKLTDHVFTILKPKPVFENPTDKMDPRLRQVTILHCLQHSGGWDRSASFDPMFQSVRIARSLGVEPPARAEHVIRFMMGKPLDFDPGTRYAYSNYGYCLLGRVIEA